MIYWWFYHSSHEELWARPDPSKGIPLNDVKYGKEGIRAVLKEANDWLPMEHTDSCKCENAFHTQPKKIAVFEHRLAMVDVDLLQLEPIYWQGSRCPVRRSAWFITGVGSTGILPLPKLLEDIVERKYQESCAWITEPAGQESAATPVEKMADLERPFHEHMVAFKKGQENQAIIYPVTRSSSPSLIRSPSLGSLSDTLLTLVRGYENVLKLNPSLNLPKLTLNSLEDTEIQYKPPKHLILAVHGIGQKVAGKHGFGFLRDSNSLRTQLNAAMEDRGMLTSNVMVLPVFWRLDLRLPAHYYRNENTSAFNSGFDLVLSRVVPPSVPLIRSLFSDIALDILLYLTPKHRDLIITVLLRELLRIYNLFLAWNPGFTGDVHFYGHSLGSTILADMLSHNLCPFPVKCMFAVGSPAALFFLLKHQRPIGCTFHNSVAARQHLSHEEEPESIVFHCHSYYNIYHPHDPVAYRLEPLVDEQCRPLQPPFLLPYHKPGLTKLKLGIDERIGKAREDIGNAWRQLSMLTARFLPPSDVAGTTSDPSAQSMSSSQQPPQHDYPTFNRKGRVDFCLQDSLVESAYLRSLTAHFSYWTDHDIAMFIVGELG